MHPKHLNANVRTVESAVHRISSESIFSTAYTRASRFCAANLRSLWRMLHASDHLEWRRVHVSIVPRSNYQR